MTGLGVTPVSVAFYGAGQVSTNSAAILSERPHVTVLGPFGRDARDDALRSGADVVVIATTSFLAQVADDIFDAVDAGSNVITTAEEAAYPWGNDVAIARRLDALARSRGVSILGAGLNPGFVFDAMVLTAAGVVERLDAVRAERVVDLSGFGAAVLSRIGVGHSPDAFADGVRCGTVTGHIGFPQSMRVVAGRLGVEIERIERDLEPILAEQEHATASLRVKVGETAGFRQRYTAISRRAGVVRGEVLRSRSSGRDRRGAARCDHDREPVWRAPFQRDPGNEPAAGLGSGGSELRAPRDRRAPGSAMPGDPEVAEVAGFQRVSGPPPTSAGEVRVAHSIPAIPRRRRPIPDCAGKPVSDQRLHQDRHTRRDHAFELPIAPRAAGDHVTLRLRVWDEVVERVRGIRERPARAVLVDALVARTAPPE